MSSCRMGAVLLAGMLALSACSGADAPPRTAADSPVETTSEPAPTPVAPGLTVSYDGDPCRALTAEVVGQFLPEAGLQPFDAGPQTPETLSKLCGYGSLYDGRFVLISVPNGRPFTDGGFSSYRTGEGPWEGCGTRLERRETTFAGLPALILTCGADQFAMAIGSPLDDRLSACGVRDVGASDAVAEQLCRSAFARVIETSTAPSR